MDAALLGMPLDAIVAGYAYADPKRFLLYAAMAAAGSALGSIVIYLIGYKGGEVLLVKRIGEKRFNKIKASFERHEFWAVMFPAMLPPPTPFKLFVLSAGVAEMRFHPFPGRHFLRQAAALLADFADRDPLRPADPRLCGQRGAQPSAIRDCRGRGGSADWLVDVAAAQTALAADKGGQVRVSHGAMKIQVELAFRPASKPFLSCPEPASAGGIGFCLDFFRNAFRRAERVCVITVCRRCGSRREKKAQTPA